MNIWQKKRLIGIVFFGLITSCLMWFILSMMGSRINVYLTPSELKTANTSHPDRKYRIGGLVKAGSLHWIDKEHLRFEFTIIDSDDELVVEYAGIAPSLFKEGKGVIAQGALVDGRLKASMLLAKHDENYQPPGVK